MSKLVAVYGDAPQLESALSALADAGLADNSRVIGGGKAPGDLGDGAVDGAAADRAERGNGSPEADRDAGNAIPAVVPGGGAPPASPAVLDPLAVPPGSSRAVGLVGDGPGGVSTSEDLEGITGGDADEARFYAEALDGGASLLVVEGSASELDRAEAALAEHEGQGMVRR